MLAIIVIFVVVVIVGVLVFAATRPDTFRVQRQTMIKASPGKIFGYINDFHNWAAWSPWEKMDPALQRSFSGAPSGKGSVYEWMGNRKVGQGRMEIVESLPSSTILIKLDFIKPFEGHNMAEFTLAAQEDMTLVTWAMYGPSPYITKLMGLFFNMDALIGKDFEAGLATMKMRAEQ